MVKVVLFLGGFAILLVSFRQMFLMFRDGSFRSGSKRPAIPRGAGRAYRAPIIR